jgi:hypothetical protein
MHRRSLLATLGAGVATAGCLSLSSSESVATDTTTRDVQRVEVPGSPVTALTLQAIPDGVPFDHAVTFHGQPSADEPARVTVSITNRGDRAHTVRSTDEALPFPEPSATSEDGDSLVLLASRDDAERRDGCWIGHARTLPRHDQRTLQPDGSVSHTYALVTDAETDGCYRPATYPFTHPYTLNPDGSAVAYEWGFAIHVG